MKLGRYTITFNFFLPWYFGYDEGWGCSWFDIGPFTIWWSNREQRAERDKLLKLVTNAHKWSDAVAAIIQEQWKQIVDNTQRKE